MESVVFPTGIGKSSGSVSEVELIERASHFVAGHREQHLELDALQVAHGKLRVTIAHIAALAEHRADEMTEIAAGMQRERTGGIVHAGQQRPHRRVVAIGVEFEPEAREVAHQAALDRIDQHGVLTSSS